MDEPTSELLQKTRGAAIRDAQLATADGNQVSNKLHGVSIRNIKTIVDERGTLFETYDPRWNFDEDPLVYGYIMTIRPGVVKGWALHETHADRYYMISGRLDILLYDVRPDSPTCGQLQKVTQSDFDRKLILIPPFVWHAVHNIGDTEAVMGNFATKLYNHAKPDKFRLPIGTPLIPYDFGDVIGG